MGEGVGTVIEEQIYILIDTSESMVPSIQYVKDKLFLLVQVYSRPDRAGGVGWWYCDRRADRYPNRYLLEYGVQHTVCQGLTFPTHAGI